MSWLSIASQGSQAIGGFFSGLASSSAFETQAKLSLLKQKQEALYKNDALRAAAKATSSAADQFEGAQKAALAFSGFDISTGDNRMFADTQRKAAAEIRGMNEQTTRETFEAERKAMMDAIYYKAQSKIAKIGAYTSLIGGAAKTGLAMYDDYQENGEKSAWGKFKNLFGFGKDVVKDNGFNAKVDKRPI
jgi:hypothetical protein